MKNALPCFLSGAFQSFSIFPVLWPRLGILMPGDFPFKGVEFFSESLFKIILSIFIGGALGAEREFRSKSAGFRTLILISLAATLFTILSMGLGGKGNPDRIASNILTGIGFLGAGVIFKEENKVMGLTTAITIWVVSALGMCIGFGLYALAMEAGILSLLVLYSFSKIQGWMDRLSQVRNYMIRFSDTEELEEEFREVIKRLHLISLDVKYYKANQDKTLWWTLKGNQKNQDQWVHHLIMDKRILELNY